MNRDVKDVEWTILFDFPYNSMYPNKVNGFQSEMNEHVMTWTDKTRAEEFATDKCGKYGWFLVPTKTEISIDNTDVKDHDAECFWNR